MSADWTPQVGETVLTRTGNVVCVVAVDTRDIACVRYATGHIRLWNLGDLDPMPPKPIQYLVTCEHRSVAAGERYVDPATGGIHTLRPSGAVVGFRVHVITKVEPL